MESIISDLRSHYFWKYYNACEFLKLNYWNNTNLIFNKVTLCSLNSKICLLSKPATVTLILFLWCFLSENLLRLRNAFLMLQLFPLYLIYVEMVQVSLNLFFVKNIWTVLHICIVKDIMIYSWRFRISVALSCSIRVHWWRAPRKLLVKYHRMIIELFVFLFKSLLTIWIILIIHDYVTTILLTLRLYYLIYLLRLLLLMLYTKLLLSNQNIPASNYSEYHEYYDGNHTANHHWRFNIKYGLIYVIHFIL